MLRISQFAIALAGVLVFSAFAGQSRVSFTSYGPARIGMTKGELERALGVPVKAIDFEDGATTCRYIAPAQGHDGITFMLLDDRLARIDVDTQGVNTLSGAHIDSLQSDVMELYRDRITVTPHYYTAPDGSYLTVLSSDKRHGVRFETDHGKVVRYYAGTAEAIQYVEGCQ